MNRKHIIRNLRAKGIERPTPIQVQGLPTALSGRDMIGIAFTGSGKTLVFTLPAVMFALQEELRMPLQRGEGPIGIVVAPSRELARQHYDGIVHYFKAIRADGGPELRAMLAIGGVDLREQVRPAGASAASRDDCSARARAEREATTKKRPFPAPPRSWSR